MNNKQTDKPATPQPRARDQKRASSLRENLLKRKHQARARKEK